MRLWYGCRHVLGGRGGRLVPAQQAEREQREDQHREQARADQRGGGHRAELAQRFGLESILGAFLAGAIIGLVDRDSSSHPQFRTKLDAIGYGFLVPIFFVSSGIRLNLTGLLHSPSSLVRVPVFLLALLVVRGLPAFLGLRANGTRPTLALGLLQATSLPFIVTITQIGVALGKITPVTAAALVCAGLLSVLIFPLIALALLRRDAPAPVPVPAVTQPVPEPHLM